jgi:hypothetical protein
MIKTFRAIALVAAFLVATPALAASGKSQTLRNSIPNQIFRSVAWTPPATLELHLESTCSDGAGGLGVEVDPAYAYTHQVLNPGATNWGINGTNGNATAGALSNITAITFPTVTGTNWTVRCVSIRTGTTRHYWGDVNGSPQTVTVGSTASFATNALTITEAAAGMPSFDEMQAVLGRPIETLADLLAFYDEADRLARLEAMSEDEAVSSVLDPTPDVDTWSAQQ